MLEHKNSSTWYGTTIVSVRRGAEVAIAGDGQVTLGNICLKSNAKKVRRIGTKDNIIAGFAGATADAFALFERLESKLEKYPTRLMHACVELAKDWRTDKYLRRLEAMMAVADNQVSLIITGNGDVLEPENGLIGIGSGGAYALAAAQAMMEHSTLDAIQIAQQSIHIAAKLCIYTNSNIVTEYIKCNP